jgi:hypothetical protein
VALGVCLREGTPTCPGRPCDCWAVFGSARAKTKQNNPERLNGPQWVVATPCCSILGSHSSGPLAIPFQSPWSSQILGSPGLRTAFSLEVVTALSWGSPPVGDLYLRSCISHPLSGTQGLYLRHYWKKGDLWVGPFWLGPQVGGSCAQPECTQMPPLFLSPHCLSCSALAVTASACCSSWLYPDSSHPKRAPCRAGGLLGPHLIFKKSLLVCIAPFFLHPFVLMPFSLGPCSL